MSARPLGQPLQAPARGNKRLPLAKRIRRFFEKKPAPAAAQGNRKGEGFRLTRPKRTKTKKPWLRLVLGGFGSMALLTLTALILTSLSIPPDFIVLAIAALVLGGVVFFDVSSRRRWEKSVVGKIDDICERHDRLVREVARNRSDITQIKDGLGRLAAGLRKDGAGSGTSPETAMIGRIASQLEEMGEQPRALIESGQAPEVLELEMTPPPAKPEPVSGIDGETAPDFAKFTDTVVTELVRYAVRNDKIEIFLQPVVTLPQRKTKLHEVYARISAGSGTYIPAGRYLNIARQENMLPAIDNLLLLRCLEILRGRRGDTNSAYILNISCATLNDRSFMNDLVAFLSQNHKTAERLIFELAQDELHTQSEAVLPVIDGLVKLGCRFSMDRVRHRTIDIRHLRSMNIRFIKLDAAWLLKEGQDREGFSRIVRLKKQLDAAGIDLIVERIESETVLRELLDYNIDYGQGYLFGKPDHSAAYRATVAA